MENQTYNGYTVEELAKLGFCGFRSDGQYVWEHADKERWRNLARAIAEAIINYPKEKI